MNSKHPSVSYSDVLSTKAMVMTWLSDALQYELWLASDGSIPHDIYFSDLSWPIGKILYWKKTREVKQQLGITKLNAAEKEEEVSTSPLIFLKANLFITWENLVIQFKSFLNRYTRKQMLLMMPYLRD